MKRALHLLKSTLIVIVFFGIGKFTGLIRARLVSMAFGTGAQYDAFTAANQLPEVFYILIAGGALAAAFIPVYSAYLSDERSKESARLANTILTLVLLVLGSVSAVGAVFAPWLVRVILVPSFSPEQQALTASLMRIILLQTTIYGVSGVLSSILNAHQHFALPALAPLSLDIGYIVGIYWLVPRWGIHGLAWGTVVGSFLHIGIQVPALVRYQIGYRPMLAWEMSGVREIVRLMGPRIVALGAVQMADLFIIRLASGLPQGSTSGYFYAYALMQLPETLFGTAVALVMFPTMAELFNVGDVAGLKRTAVNSLKIIWALTIPAAFGLVFLGEKVVSVLLEGGQFSAASTRLVYGVLAAFSLRLVSEATLEVVARLFYARHNTRTPMLAYLGWLVIQVVLGYVFINLWGVAGLALASSVAFTALSAVLFAWNRRELGGLAERELGGAMGRAVLASLGMTAVILGIGQVVLNPRLFLLLGAGGGALVYALLNWLLGGRELQDLWQLAHPKSA